MEGHFLKNTVLVLVFSLKGTVSQRLYPDNLPYFFLVWIEGAS